VQVPQRVGAAAGRPSQDLRCQLPLPVAGGGCFHLHHLIPAWNSTSARASAFAGAARKPPQGGRPGVHHSFTTASSRAPGWPVVGGYAASALRRRPGQDRFKLLPAARHSSGWIAGRRLSSRASSRDGGGGSHSRQKSKHNSCSRHVVIAKVVEPAHQRPPAEQDQAASGKRLTSLQRHFCAFLEAPRPRRRSKALTGPKGFVR